MYSLARCSRAAARPGGDTADAATAVAAREVLLLLPMLLVVRGCCALHHLSVVPLPLQ